MFGDLERSLNASRGLSAIAECLVFLAAVRYVVVCSVSCSSLLWDNSITYNVCVKHCSWHRGGSSRQFLGPGSWKCRLLGDRKYNCAARGVYAKKSNGFTKVRRQRRRYRDAKGVEGTPPPLPTRGSEGASWAPPAGSGWSPSYTFQQFLSIIEMTERCKCNISADWLCLSVISLLIFSDVNKDLNLKTKASMQGPNSQGQGQDQGLELQSQGQGPRTVVHEKAITLQ